MLSLIGFEMMAGDKFEEDEAEARAGGEAGVEEPEVRGGHRFVEATDPSDEPVPVERLSRHSFGSVIESGCEFEVDGDHAGRFAVAAR